jgi:hypothetical protein
MNYCWTTNKKGKGSKWINGWYEYPGCCRGNNKNKEREKIQNFCCEKT